MALSLGVPFADRASYDVATIAGHTNLRNLNHQSSDYSITLKIDQELQECMNRIPAQWWNGAPRPNSPLAEVYQQASTKLMYYTMAKLLHVPYMLEPSIDSNHEYSKLTTLLSCREMIKAYQVFGHHPDFAAAVCDIMDFQVFTAAVVLVIGFLTLSPSLHSDQERED